MAQLRVRGIVKLANLLRRQLGGGVSAAALEQLRLQVSEGIEHLDMVMADHELTPAAMSVQARKAYEFLKSVDFDAIEPSEQAREDEYYLASVRLPGLKRFVSRLADRLADAIEPGQLDELHRQLVEEHRAIEELMDTECIRLAHLKDESRALRAWVGYFADHEHFDVYVSAVGRARPLFGEAVGASHKYQPPARVCFCPMKGLYSIRAVADGTRVSLPTPMIALPEQALAHLAAMGFRRAKANEALDEQMLAKPYQAVLADLDALAGVAESARGVFHDLGAAFDRVNAAYFDGRMRRPKLVWGRAMTMRKFGHYDRVHDTVMVSASLDAENVPMLVIDFIVYHELLHKQLGVAWRNGRRAAHTPEFRRAQQHFDRQTEAEAFLSKLASAARGSRQRRSVAEG